MSARRAHSTELRIARAIQGKRDMSRFYKKPGLIISGFSGQVGRGSLIRIPWSCMRRECSAGDTVTVNQLDITPSSFYKGTVCIFLHVIVDNCIDT